jgi:CD2 antigen cytoplasmic tail-binding protein 2
VSRWAKRPVLCGHSVLRPTGPFSVQQLNGWRMTGFFGSPACENVEVRLIRGQGDVRDWGSWQDVVGA